MSPDPSYTPSLEKIEQAERLEKLPNTRFIRSNNGTRWHVGRKHLSRGLRSCLAMSAVYLPICNGRQLGGPWGYTSCDSLPTGADLCPRCFKTQLPQ